MAKHSKDEGESTNTEYQGRHVDTSRQPAANTERGRLVESLPDSHHGDIADELDRGDRYGKRN